MTRLGSCAGLFRGDCLLVRHCTSIQATFAALENAVGERSAREKWYVLECVSANITVPITDMHILHLAVTRMHFGILNQVLARVALCAAVTSHVLAIFLLHHFNKELATILRHQSVNVLQLFWVEFSIQRFYFCALLCCNAICSRSRSRC